MVIHNTTQFIGLVCMLVGAAGLGHCFQRLVNPEQ
jgi:hypothetical protein